MCATRPRRAGAPTSLGRVSPVSRDWVGFPPRQVDQRPTGASVRRRAATNVGDEERPGRVKPRRGERATSSGALIGRTFDEVMLPEVQVRAEGGGAIGSPKEMRLIDNETFSKANDAAFFPGDFEVEKAGAGTYQAKLTLKKHKLLGEPFESEWK